VDLDGLVRVKKTLLLLADFPGTDFLFDYLISYQTNSNSQLLPFIMRAKPIWFPAFSRRRMVLILPDERLLQLTNFTSFFRKASSHRPFRDKC
jgi:hypothetical protein